MNPLVKFFDRSVFGKTKSRRAAYLLSIGLATLVVAVVVGLLLGTLLPQLVSSVGTFLGNLEGYVESLERWMSRSEILRKYVQVEEILSTVTQFLSENAGKIIDTSLTAGRSVINTLIAFILAIYFLAEKESLKAGTKRILGAIMKPRRYNDLMQFALHCDSILIRYIISILLDSLIVSTVNMIFMLVTGMSYAALVSFVVGITNMVPTFGPFIGGAIGVFILLLVNPVWALWFLIFTICLQTVDGYIIKPKLFGNSLGTSGLSILVGIILGGRLFGVMGVLFAIPVVAILTEIYRSYLLPLLEEKRAEKEAAAKKEAAEAEDPDLPQP